MSSTAPTAVPPVKPPTEAPIPKEDKQGHGSTGASKTKSKAKGVSLAKRLVGPVKSYITGSVNPSTKYSKYINNHLTKYFHEESVEPVDERSLGDAEFLIGKGQAYVARLENLRTYILDKFKDEEFQNSPDKDKYEEEVVQMLQGSKFEEVLTHLKDGVQRLQAELKRANHVLSPQNTRGYIYSDYTPSSDEEQYSDSEPEDVLTDDRKSPLPSASPNFQNLSPQLSGNGSEKDTLFGPTAVYPPSDSLAAELVSSVERNKALERKNKEMAENERLLRKRISELEDQKAAERCAQERRIQEGQAELKEYRDRQRERSNRWAELRATGDDTPLNLTTQSSSQSQLPSVSNCHEQPDRATRQGIEGNDYSAVAQLMAETQARVFSQFSEVTLRQTTLLESLSNQVTDVVQRAPQKDDGIDQAGQQARRECRRDQLEEQHPKTNYKLAMDFLISFDGSPSSNFKQFHSMFKSTVLSNANIGDETRLAILLSKLEGDALRCIADNEDPAVAMNTTLQSLEAVYGKNDTKRSLLHKFKTLQFHHSAPKQMRIDLVTHKNLANQLCAKGLAKDDERITIAILEKLPRGMKTRVADYYSKLISKDTVSVELLYSFISKVIDSWQVEVENSLQPKTSSGYRNEIPDEYRVTRAAIEHHANLHDSSQGSYKRNEEGYNRNSGQRSYAPRQETHRSPPRLVYNAAAYRGIYKDPYSAKSLPAFYRPGTGVQVKSIHRTFPLKDEASRVPCKACGGPHNPVRCGLTSWEFRNSVDEKRLCPICVGKHKIEVCTYKLRCVYCSGLHHTGGCPEKEYYRDQRNYPEGANRILQFFRELHRPRFGGRATKTHSQ